MQTIEQLNQSFAIDHHARFEAGHGGMTRLVLSLPTGEAHVYLYGAHVTHYQPKDQPPVLFMGAKAFFQEGKAIRGGIPICWPWFGPREGDTSKMHGFVRTMTWDVAEVSRSGDAIRAAFTLASNDQTRVAWDHDFALRYTVMLGSQLTTELDTRNSSNSDFRFEQALHTYFQIADIKQIVVEGLAGTTYIDKVGPPPERKLDAENDLHIKGQTDRVYLNAPQTCTIEDPVLKRRISIAKDNSETTVVWNPWSDRIGTFADLSPEDWHKFICVEACNAKDNVVNVAAGGAHAMRMRIRSEAM
jgi:glucose-6-phosphate 1-epimerase